MKNHYCVFYLLTAVCLIFALTSGCSESENTGGVSVDGSGNKRTMLIANENIQLKETIAQKDRKIAELNQKIRQCEDEQEKIKKNAEDASKFIMERFVDCTQQLQSLKEENKKLQQQTETAESE